VAIIYIEGFDHYDGTADAGGQMLMKGWSIEDTFYIAASGEVVGDSSVLARRIGTKFAVVHTSIVPSATSRNLTASGPTIIMGYAYRSNVLGANGQLVTLYDGDGDIAVRLNYLSGGSIRLRGGAVDETSAANVIKANTWQHIEFKVLLHESAGTYEVRVNQVNVLSDSGVDTQSGLATIGKLELSGALYSGYMCYDDMFILDGSGGKNDDFRRDCRVDTLLSNGAGTYTDFAPSAGANWENVDDPDGLGGIGGGDIDSDTTHNESKTVGHKDTYNLDNIVALGTTIYGVAANSCVRKTDAGIKYFKQLTKAGATEDLSAEIAATDNFQIYQKPMDVNPDDSAAWEEADVNALESGVELTT